MNPIVKESKYIEFLLVNETAKTQTWQVLEKTQKNQRIRKETVGYVIGYVLGHIKWYGPWRQYCFFPSSGMVLTIEFLKDISEKIRILMNERKMK